MPASSTLTTKHSHAAAARFIGDVQSNASPHYVFVSRPVPWTDDAAPESANTSVTQSELSVFSEIAYGKRIANSAVLRVATRHDWANGVIYASWDSNDPDLWSKPYHVVGVDGKVFKCLWNGGNAASTVQPTLADIDGPFSTSDGYVWRYMYTIDPTANAVFNSSTYMPVTPNTAVSSAAVDGAIDYIRVSTGGNNYFVHSEGFLASASNGSILELPADASPITGIYTGYTLYLKGGSGYSQARQIINYGGLDRLVTVSPSFDLYVDLQVANATGTIVTGQIASQLLQSVQYINKKGYFNDSDTVTQTFTAAQGTVHAANSTALVIEQTSVKLRLVAPGMR